MATWQYIHRKVLSFCAGASPCPYAEWFFIVYTVNALILHAAWSVQLVYATEPVTKPALSLLACQYFAVCFLYTSIIAKGYVSKGSANKTYAHWYIFALRMVFVNLSGCCVQYFFYATWLGDGALSHNSMAQFMEIGKCAPWHVAQSMRILFSPLSMTMMASPESKTAILGMQSLLIFALVWLTALLFSVCRQITHCLFPCSWRHRVTGVVWFCLLFWPAWRCGWNDFPTFQPGEGLRFLHECANWVGQWGASYIWSAVESLWKVLRWLASIPQCLPVVPGQMALTAWAHPWEAWGRLMLLLVLLPLLPLAWKRCARDCAWPINTVHKETAA